MATKDKKNMKSQVIGKITAMNDDDGTFTIKLREAISMLHVKQWVDDEVVAYLRAHEDDIAMSIDDFGDLNLAFIDFVGRRPREKKEVSC